MALPVAGATTSTFCKKMKLFAAFLFSAILGAMLFTPHRDLNISAIEENLWTSRGKLGVSSQQEGVVSWMRKEWGWPHTWMVHDSSVTDSAWHLRFEPVLLSLYGFISALPLFLYIATKSKSKNRAEQAVGGNGGQAR